MIDEINKEIISCMKNKDKNKANILRMIISEAKNYAISNVRDVNDDDVIKACKKLIKGCNVTLDAAKKQGRNDVVISTMNEINVYSKYVPKMMTEEEVEGVVKNIMLGLEDKSFSSLMKESMKKLKGKAEGKIVAAVCKKVVK